MERLNLKQLNPDTLKEITDRACYLMHTNCSMPTSSLSTAACDLMALLDHIEDQQARLKAAETALEFYANNQDPLPFQYEDIRTDEEGFDEVYLRDFVYENQSTLYDGCTCCVGAPIQYEKGVKARQALATLRGEGVA